MAINLQKWILENEDKLKPPVNAYAMFPLSSGMLVMVIGGKEANRRKDYHVNPTPEFFYQYKGDMVLGTIDENGQREDIPIREGEMYVCAAYKPHSPQRPAGTIGVVLEIPRNGKKDAMRFYCEKCNAVTFDEEFICTDLPKQVKECIQKYGMDEDGRKCECGFVNPSPLA